MKMKTNFYPSFLTYRGGYGYTVEVRENQSPNDALHHAKTVSLGKPVIFLCRKIRGIIINNRLAMHPGI